MPATSSWGPILPSRPSVLSRFRLAGMAVILGIGLAGTVAYSLVNSAYLGLVLSRTLGPYSDALASHIFEHRDPEVWRQIAMRHGVVVVVEEPGRAPVVIDSTGERLAEPPPVPSRISHGRIQAVRTAPDGTRITFYWRLWTFRESHLPLVAGLLIIVIAVVSAVFWFLQRQLKPLARLHTGVEAVARGDFEARVPVVRDDEIGQVARAFNGMAGRVGEMLADRERLLADVSHELRSPLARMKVALELLPESDKRAAVARDLREMESLIRVLLEREALRSRSARLEAEAVDLAALAREAVAKRAELGPGIAIEASGEVVASGERALLELLLRNLLDNAVRFSLPDSAPVVVTLESGEDGAVLLRVADDGVGIPPGSEEKLFEPFVKLDRARGHRAGYGLGLDLCRRIVELHGGSIELRSRRPRGAEAIVALPPR